MASHNKKIISVLFGVPSDKSRDHAMMSAFFAEQGDHIICGGSTATAAACYLGKSIHVELDSADPQIPPIAHIEGVFLVTEGVLTMRRVHEILTNDDPACGSDGASLVARALRNATDIRFYVGLARSAEKLALGIPDGIKRSLTEDIAALLMQKGKSVICCYYE